MSLFQKSVLSNYLDSVSDSEIDKGWSSLQSYKEMASKVQSFKEEEFQADFLTIIFADCFGYISNYKSGAEGNLFFEQKNKVGSKKADGTIIKDGEVIAVIELKSTKTKNLDDVKEQAFGYYTNNSKCEYVITSNFNKLRFYIERNEDYLEFDLFNIDKEEFKLLWLCLDSKNLLEGKPKEIKNKSLINEENITKKLYQDYSTFRQELFNDLVENNQTVEKRVILNKTQKLLDRLLFILFSEDRGLLPANSISEIINHWEFGGDSLYSTFLTYFEIINKGRPKRGDKKGIYAYNGGLFSEDVVLNTLNLSDDVLLSNVKKLTKYDFESDVSVDILGHIFEHSLSEIEELQNQIDGAETDKSKSKRKKDGVYYTPKYITKYIVDNTLGKLCDEKKIELDINEETYSPSAKRSRNRISALDDYRSWLLQLSICDPACGSGAFLIQALNFLIKEHHYIDELSASYNKDSLVLSDVKNSILENNLYGVDINQESVEIAKLSLWLNTAESNRKLTSLNSNIKCGNSLIDDPTVAGDKAFNWKNEFPEIFKNGGFDVVIGNPPYVQSHSLSESEKDFIYNNFKTAEYQINTYGVFVEQFINLLKLNSFYSLIIPNYWLSTKYDKELRKSVFIDNYALEVINTFEVFESATVDTLILTGKKKKNQKEKTSFLSIPNSLKSIDERLNAINLRLWDFEEYKSFKDGDEDEFISFNKELKLKGKNTLKDFILFKMGLKPYEKGKGTPAQTREMMNEKVYHSSKKEDETYLPLLGAKHIKRNFLAPYQEYIKYGKNLAAPRNPEIFEGERILVNRILSKDKIDGVLVSDTYINNTDVFNLLPLKDNIIDIRILYALIISKLCATFFKRANVNLNRNAFPKINVGTLETFPIPNIPDDIQEKIKLLVDEILNETSVFYNSISKFISVLQDNLELTKMSKKLDAFFKLDFKDFLSELKKQKVTLSLSDQSEWKDYFEETKSKVNTIQVKIAKMDKEIDQMVYELYGLTKEEIEIVENS